MLRSRGSGYLKRQTAYICFVKTVDTSCYIMLIYQVERSGLYLQDDFSRVARFPNGLGNFETTLWLDRTSLEVKGTHMGAADNTAPLPSPQDFGIASTSSTSVSQGAAIQQESVFCSSKHVFLIGLNQTFQIIGRHSQESFPRRI